MRGRRKPPWPGRSLSTAKADRTAGHSRAHGSCVDRPASSSSSVPASSLTAVCTAAAPGLSGRLTSWIGPALQFSSRAADTSRTNLGGRCSIASVGCSWSVLLTPIPLGSSLAVPATCDPGCTTYCTAATLGSFSRSALLSAPGSASLSSAPGYASLSSAPGRASLSSAPGRASLSSPPGPICCEAAGANETEADTAAATIGPTSLFRLSYPALMARRTLGRGCSNAQGMCVDQPAFIISTSTAGQAVPQYNTIEPGLGCSSVQDTCVDHPASIMSAASQALLQCGVVDDGIRGKAASYEHCRTAVSSPNYTVNYTEARAGRLSNETSDPASLSKARIVTLRYCDSFCRSCSTVKLYCHYWHIVA